MSLFRKLLFGQSEVEVAEQYAQMRAALRAHVVEGRRNPAFQDLGCRVTEDGRYAFARILVGDAIWFYFETPEDIMIRQVGKYDFPQIQHIATNLADSFRLLLDTDPASPRVRGEAEDYELAILNEPSTYELREAIRLENGAACGWHRKERGFELVVRFRNRIARVSYYDMPPLTDEIASAMYRTLATGLDGYFASPLAPSLYYPGSGSSNDSHLGGKGYLSQMVSCTWGIVGEQTLMYVSGGGRGPHSNTAVIPIVSPEAAKQILVALRAPWMCGDALQKGESVEAIADRYEPYVPPEMTKLIRQHWATVR